MDEEDIELLEETYRKHCEGIVDIILCLQVSSTLNSSNSLNTSFHQFDDLEQFWFRFWRMVELDGKSLAREKMMLMFSINRIS